MTLILVIALIGPTARITLALEIVVERMVLLGMLRVIMLVVILVLLLVRSFTLVLVANATPRNFPPNMVILLLALMLFVDIALSLASLPAGMFLPHLTIATVASLAYRVVSLAGLMVAYMMLIFVTLGMLLIVAAGLVVIVVPIACMPVMLIALVSLALVLSLSTLLVLLDSDQVLLAATLAFAFTLLFALVLQLAWARWRTSWRPSPLARRRSGSRVHYRPARTRCS